MLGRQYHQMVKLCKENSENAAKKLIELMSCEDPRVAYMAAESVLNRAFGKVREAPPPTDDNPEQQEGRNQLIADVHKLLETRALQGAALAGPKVATQRPALASAAPASPKREDKAGADAKPAAMGQKTYLPERTAAP